MTTELKPVAVEQKQELQLENLLPGYCALTWSQFAICAFWSALFLIFCYFPVSEAKTWQSVNEAAFHNTVEKTVSLPLSQGVRSIAIGQSGKQFLAFLYQTGGAEYLSNGFAILQLVAFGLWTFVLYRIYPHSLSLVAAAGIAVGCFYQLNGLHTEIFGQICGAILILVLISAVGKERTLQWSKATRFHWLAVVLVMVLWTNLDGSFVLGLGGLAILAAAQLWKRRPTSFSSIVHSFSHPEFHHRVWLFEIAFLATLLTPQGTSLWQSMLWWPDNPIITALGTATPAYLASWTALIIAIAWGIWTTFAVKSKHAPSTTLTLLAIGATAVTCLNHELVFWFAAVMAMAIIELVSKLNRDGDPAARQKSVQRSSTVDSKPSSFKYVFTLLAGLVIWMAFCFSPFGSKMLGGSKRTPIQLVGSHLPTDGKLFLQQNETDFLHCPIYWSDWLSAGSNQPVMVNRGLHNTPAMANQDYQHIYQGVPDWRKIAEKYELTGLFVDKTNQRRLIRNLRRRPGQWQTVYEDSQCVIYQRQL